MTTSVSLETLRVTVNTAVATLSTSLGSTTVTSLMETVGTTTVISGSGWGSTTSMSSRLDSPSTPGMAPCLASRSIRTPGPDKSRPTPPLGGVSPPAAVSSVASVSVAPVGSKSRT